jgi:hypothetical protein
MVRNDFSMRTISGYEEFKLFFKAAEIIVASYRRTKVHLPVVEAGLRAMTCSYYTKRKRVVPIRL